MSKIVNGTCDICKRQFEASSELAIKRSIGCHKAYAHGIRGMTGRERYYVYNKGMTLEQAKAHIAANDKKKPYVGIEPPLEPGEKLIPTPEAISDEVMAQDERRKEYARQYRASHRKQKPQNNGGSDAVPAHLSECPNCHCRFWITKGQ